MCIRDRSVCSAAVVPPRPLVLIPTALPDIFPTPIISLPINSNETLATMLVVFATLTAVAFAVNTAPPALSIEVSAVLFNKTKFSFTAKTP